MCEPDIRIQSIYFSCPRCGNKGKATEIHYMYGINDYGGFILKCRRCNHEFFLQSQNPSDGPESTVDDGDFNIVEILDFELENDKKKADDLEKSSNVVLIEGEEGMPFLKDAWEAKTPFNINEEDEVFICKNCKVNIEGPIFANIEKNLPIINEFYKKYFDFYLKGYVNPIYIILQSQIICPSCKNKIEFISYSKFNGFGGRYKVGDFLIGDTREFNPKINGLYSREEAKRILEKFILRWNLLASQVFIISPFIGFGKNIEQKKDKGNSFRELLDWLLTILDKSKTKLIIRKTEYKKIKDFLGGEIFDALRKYDLINPLIEGINDRSSPRFHAKFYAGIIPKADKCVVEILSGSYNIHGDSKTKENLMFATLDFPDFNKRYLQPLKIEVKCKSLANFEVFKIVNDTYKLLKIKTMEDLWVC